MAKSAARETLLTRQKFKAAQSLEPARFTLSMLSRPGDLHLLLVPYYDAVQAVSRCQNCQNIIT